MDIIKTPTLLRTMARAIEKNERSVIRLLAREINYRMIQILNEQTSPDGTPKN